MRWNGRDRARTADSCPEPGRYIGAMLMHHTVELASHVYAAGILKTIGHAIGAVLLGVLILGAIIGFFIGLAVGRATARR